MRKTRNHNATAPHRCNTKITGRCSQIDPRIIIAELYDALRLLDDATCELEEDGLPPIENLADILDHEPSAIDEARDEIRGSIAYLLHAVVKMPTEPVTCQSCGQERAKHLVCRYPYGNAKWTFECDCPSTGYDFALDRWSEGDWPEHLMEKVWFNPVKFYDAIIGSTA